MHIRHGAVARNRQRFMYDTYRTRGWAANTDRYRWVCMFHGGTFDGLAGLYSFRGRHYDPTLGTWMEEDGAYSGPTAPMPARPTPFTPAPAPVARAPAAVAPIEAPIQVPFPVLLAGVRW